MAPRRCRFGHRTNSGIGCRVTEIWQLNAAILRIALVQARCYLPARELLKRRKGKGDGGMEALRILKGRLSDVVYKAMLADQSRSLSGAA